jgi:DNA-binding response OmpR family regulator
VLIIDDDYEVGEVLRRMLGHKEYEVRVATDGEGGMDAFHGGSFSLVVVDMGLPGMSGQDVAKEVKASRPGTPVIMITGWGTQLDPKEMGGMGVDAVISKPFTREKIYRQVSELLRTGG